MQTNEYALERLSSTEPLPMDLLLLADETSAAIVAYVHDSEVWVLRQQQVVVAVACVLEMDARYVELKNLAVATALQGRGCGQWFFNSLKTPLCCHPCANVGGHG